jgi:hypothetical protein
VSQSYRRLCFYTLTVKPGSGNPDVLYSTGKGELRSLGLNKDRAKSLIVLENTTTFIAANRKITTEMSVSRVPLFLSQPVYRH